MSSHFLVWYIGRQQSVVGNRNILLRSGVKKGRFSNKKISVFHSPRLRIHLRGELEDVRDGAG